MIILKKNKAAAAPKNILLIANNIHTPGKRKGKHYRKPSFVDLLHLIKKKSSVLASSQSKRHGIP